jgi:DNA ligase 1
MPAVSRPVRPTRYMANVDQLAATCERIAATSSRLEKIAILAEHFRELDDADLKRTIHFLTGSPVAGAPREQNLFGSTEPPRLSLGHSTIRAAVQRATGWDPETLRACFRAVGDTGETVGHLLRVRQPDGHQPFPTREAELLLFRLLGERQTVRREQILSEVFQRYEPLAIKYFIKSMSGNFRIGLLAKMVEEAVAVATGVDADTIRAANNLSGDLAETAIAARQSALNKIKVRLSHPMAFMLAKPVADPMPDPLQDQLRAEAWLVEDKYDGIRAQIHVEYGAVEIFSRSGERVTSSFPDVVDAASSMTGTAILDGEILAWHNNRAQPFAVLQQRLARKNLKRSLRESVPVTFMSYDILYRDSELLLNEPVEIRRRKLVEAVQGTGLRLADQVQLSVDSSIDALFDQARDRGNEGLILKQPGSLYETSKRSGSWLKVKKVFATLDVVVTAAEQGHGKRTGVLSDLTFAVSKGNQYLNIGKAYSGLTNKEILEMTKLLKATTIGRYGRALQVAPSLVLEVGFDGIQHSSRHKSGFALRFPRILRWRTDKRPEDCDTLETVEELYKSALNLTAKRTERIE